MKKSNIVIFVWCLTVVWHGLVYAEGIPVEARLIPVVNAYVTNSTGNSVSVINTATHSVIATIAVPGTPTAVVSHPSDARIFVATQTQGIQVINAATNTVVSVINLGVTNIQGLALDASGEHLYITYCAGLQGGGILMRINTANYNDRALASFAPWLLGGIGFDPNWGTIGDVKIGGDGFAYVSNGGNVLQIDISSSSFTLVSTYNLYSAGGLDVFDAMSLLFTTHGTGANFINLQSGHSKPLGIASNDIAHSPDGRFVYVAGNDTSQQLTALDASTLEVLATFSNLGNPRAVAFTPNSQFAYVTLNNSNSVAVFNTTRLSQSASIAVGQGPCCYDGIAMKIVP